jgi:hypothetical protein
MIDAGIVNKTAILRDYTNPQLFPPWADLLKAVLPISGISVLEDYNFTADVTETDFINYWNQVESKGVQVVCLMTGGLPNIETLIAKTYRQVKPKCLVISFSPFGQLNSDWDIVEGALQYRIVYQKNYNISTTPLTIPFFNRYVNEYDIEPYFSGIGSYDAVKLLAQTVQEIQTFDPDITVSALEKINTTNNFTGAQGYVAFTPYHDLKYGWPFGHSLFCQWKYIDGTKVVVPHNNTIPFIKPQNHGYPDFIATDSLRLPYWGINGLLTEPPDPPQNFTIDSTAGSPDYDGHFNLTWTNSEGADNYTIYMSNNPFTYISKKFDIFAFQTATAPFSFDLTKGDYYFRVVAYNETGETMSSNDIHVSIPGPGSFILSTDAKTPDKDGKFNLFWTNSERAENYSVLHYSHNIVEINDSLTFLANQTAFSPFSINIKKSGDYYFTVAAYNELGHTLSNNRDIIVRITYDIWPIVTISIGSVAGVASVVSIRYFLKHKKIEKSKKKQPKLKE